WFDGFAKPDILAPGHHLVSDADPSQTLFQSEPRLQIDRHHLLLSGTSMATAVAAGAVAVVLEANRDATGLGRFALPLTPNAVKPIVQFTALRMHDDDGVEYDSLRQGAGAINAGGAATLAAAIDTRVPAGGWWLSSGVNTFTRIGGEDLLWGQNIVWGTN